jgi:hypothetical protein
MEPTEKDDLHPVAMFFEFLQRTMVHHSMWYAEVRDRMGMEKASEILDNAWKNSLAIQMKRYAKIFDLELENGMPKNWTQLSEEKQKNLKEAAALNWLATDGVWFQAVEFAEGMTLAKACNDAAWEKFSPYEALRIKRLLNLPEFPGIAGLKTAMEYRLYGTINKQSFANETETSIDFFMNECRVQLARKSKGLDDYPCKSAGIIEYTTFAQTIDARIRTKVIHCPPDNHPPHYFCGWHFYLPY